MAPATRSRRPLPRRVYWFRRLLVLAVVSGVAVAMVLGIVRLLDYSSNTGGEQATPVAAAPEDPGADAQSTKPRKKKKKDKKSQQEKDQLARPKGPCQDSDILVTPAIKEAHAGSAVKIVLEVTTVESPACYWEVSSESVFVNIDGADGTLWSSQHCPDSVPTESVVPRRERAAKVPMWWDGKESDDGCPSWTPWVDVLGTYTAVAAAKGSVTPVATGFLLGGAVAPTVTETATPTSSPSDKPSRKPSGKPSGSPSDEPSHQPSSKPSEDGRGED